MALYESLKKLLEDNGGDVQVQKLRISGGNEGKDIDVHFNGTLLAWIKEDSYGTSNNDELVTRVQIQNEIKKEVDLAREDEKNKAKIEFDEKLKNAESQVEKLNVVLDLISNRDLIIHDSK